MNMIDGKTSTGFAFTIPRERLDNMELLDALAEATTAMCWRYPTL